MYDRLTPLFRDVTDAQLVPSADGTGFYKSAALVDENDPSLITNDTVAGTAPGVGAVSARIKRDAYGVPHIYSDTDAGVTFAAGYVTAQDRSLLLDQARANAVAALIDMPGVPAIQLVLGLYTYKPTKKVLDEATALQTKSIEAQGAPGRQLLSDIDVYLAGINLWYSQNSPTTAPFTRTDIYALNGLKSQFLGQGGGQEVANASFLDAARSKLGATRGDEAYEDLRGRYDPETATTTTRSFPDQTKVSVAKPRGMVRIVNGSFRSTAPKLPASTRAAAARAATVDHPFGPPQLASNILIASGKASQTGSPLFVGGPQIGYNYPGLTLEMDLHGPDIHVRGATSAPFPGYMLIGRGEDYAWTLTSAAGDIIDTYAETLCGGSKVRYLYKGKCRAMESVDAGTISKGGKSVHVKFRRTVHGPVYGYAKARGSNKQVALSTRRSSYGRETVDQLFFQQMTYGRVHSAKDFIRAAYKTPQTFNSFYASANESAFITSGLLPLRPKGVNPDLPGQRRGQVRVEGLPGQPGAPAGHQPLDRLHRQLEQQAGQGLPGLRQPLERAVAAASEAAHRRARAPAQADAGDASWPRPTPPPPRTCASSSCGRRSRRCSTAARRPTRPTSRSSPCCRPGTTRAAAGATPTATARSTTPACRSSTPRGRASADAGLCDRLGIALCKQLEGRNARFDQPPGGQYGGWHQYMWKDLRAMLGQKVAGAYHLRYCGDGSVKTCSKELWAALDAARKRLAAQQGPDPAAWRAPEAKEQITFAPLPLITMQYTNKPTGIHQVMQFGP